MISHCLFVCGSFIETRSRNKKVLWQLTVASRWCFSFSYFCCCCGCEILNFDCSFFQLKLDCNKFLLEEKKWHSSDDCHNKIKKWNMDSTVLRFILHLFGLLTHSRFRQNVQEKSNASWSTRKTLFGDQINVDFSFEPDDSMEMGLKFGM